MHIKADKEGVEAIQALCDVALKTGGLQNLNFVNTVLAKTEREKQEDE